MQDARDGQFDGGEIPKDLQRQWIQGTGPGTKPRSSTRRGIRNIAYALLSGADGWMFDGEDALGQVDTMSLDNQRNLKLAIAKDPLFLEVAEEVAAEMNRWGLGFFGRSIIDDWRKQLDFTTKLFRTRGLHLDDRHVRESDGKGFSASIIDLALYIVNNHERTYSEKDAGGLMLLEPAPRTVRGARDLLSVGLQYGNALDFFGQDDVLYLMEDMATGEIRLSILWEWLHKCAKLTDGDAETGARAGDTFSKELFERLLVEEYAKLLRAGTRDVHDDSKQTTLPIARAIAEAYVSDSVKPAWYIDLLNINLNNHDLATARNRIALYLETFRRDRTRITENLDFAHA